MINCCFFYCTTVNLHLITITLQLRSIITPILRLYTPQLLRHVFQGFSVFLTGKSCGTDYMNVLFICCQWSHVYLWYIIFTRKWVKKSIELCIDQCHIICPIFIERAIRVLLILHRWKTIIWYTSKLMMIVPMLD